MSFFASQHPPKTLDVLGQPGQMVTIRKLGWKALRDAEIAKFRAGIEFLRQRGAAGVKEEVKKLGGEQAVHDLANADPISRYDPIVLIERSVLSWTPDRHNPTLEAEPDLTVWLAREILKFASPALFK